MEPATTGTPAAWPNGGPGDRSVLEARAAALARPLVHEEEVECVALVTFLVGERSYGVASHHVQRILGQADVSRLPWAPAAIVGVTNVQGDIVPVADVAQLLGARACRPGGPIVVVEHDGARLGVLAEAMSGLVVVPRQALVAPAEGVRATAGLVAGLTDDTLVLDGGALLTVTSSTRDSRRTDDG
jgi:chemotaxis signal transduction protein